MIETKNGIVKDDNFAQLFLELLCMLFCDCTFMF